MVALLVGNGWSEVWYKVFYQWVGPVQVGCWNMSIRDCLGGRSLSTYAVGGCHGNADRSVQGEIGDGKMRTYAMH